MKKRKAIPQYTYRQSSRAEERIIYRRIALVSLSTIVILLIVYFWGLSFINVLGLLGGKDIKNTETKTAPSSYSTPLQKPALDQIKTPTNNDKIDVTGSSTPDATVSLSINGQKFGDDLTVDKSGYFKFSAVTLQTGINQLVVTATDSSGTKQSTSVNIVLDKTSPTLTVVQPADGATLSSGTQTILVVGTTSDADGKVYVNGIQATLDPKTGNFSFNLPVVAGVNQIEVKANDAAGNSTTQKRTVTVGTVATPPTGNNQYTP